jgi:hypothetical protein
MRIFPRHFLAVVCLFALPILLFFFNVYTKLRQGEGMEIGINIEEKKKDGKCEQTDNCQKMPGKYPHIPKIKKQQNQHQSDLMSWKVFIDTVTSIVIKKHAQNNQPPSSPEECQGEQEKREHQHRCIIK